MFGVQVAGGESSAMEVEKHRKRAGALWGNRFVDAHGYLAPIVVRAERAVFEFDIGKFRNGSPKCPGEGDRAPEIAPCLQRVGERDERLSPFGVDQFAVKQG
ncbi:hypothetical protein [Streptomyces macrosporus]|uniref:hypothetical protein n=1 Tax=Streptomyces macrosporus TaxID=44032 RepID=UPI0031E0E7C2